MFLYSNLRLCWLHNHEGFFLYVGGSSNVMGWHKIIKYEATAQVTNSPQAAQQLSKGNIVFHVVNP